MFSGFSFSQIEENILSRKLMRLIEKGGPMYSVFCDKYRAQGDTADKYRGNERRLSRIGATVFLSSDEKAQTDAARQDYLNKIEELLKKGANPSYIGKTANGSEKNISMLEMTCHANEAFELSSRVMQPPPRPGHPQHEIGYIGGPSPMHDVAKLLIQYGARPKENDKRFAQNFPHLVEQAEVPAFIRDKEVKKQVESQIKQAEKQDVKGLLFDAINTDKLDLAVEKMKKEGVKLTPEDLQIKNEQQETLISACEIRGLVGTLMQPAVFNNAMTFQKAYDGLGEVGKSQIDGQDGRPNFIRMKSQMMQDALRLRIQNSGR